MKVMFVEARKILKPDDRENIKKNVKDFAEKFPQIKKLALLASIQYLNFLQEFKKNLEVEGKKIFISKGNLARYPGQILGCDITAGKKLEKKVDAFLLLGSGQFHALQLALATNKPIFIWQEKEISQLNQNEIKKLKNKRRAAIIKFLAAREVGIIVSIKPGQQKLKQAIKIKNKLEKQGKKAFLFAADTINIGELENFSCQSWLNTACPALILDSTKLVNWQEVEKFLKE